MHALHRAIALFFSSTLICPSASVAGSVAGTGGSTEVTQILNNTELITQTAQQVKMVQIQLQNALTDPNTPWGQTMDALQQLQSAYNTTQSIGYSMASAQNQFNNLYQGYGQGGNLLNKITSWSNQTRNSMQGLLSSAGWTMDQVKSEGSLIDSLRMRGQSAQGQMQAIQAGNAISVQMVQQLQELRQLQATQAQAQASYLAGVNEKAAADQAVTSEFTAKIPLDISGKPMNLKY